MQKDDRIMRIVMSVALIIAMVLWAREAAALEAEYVWMGKADGSFGEKKICIVLDPGHGGRDPGKVGTTGCYEKDINLKITEKLKMFLEMEGVEVILTRDGDFGLYSETDSNRKMADMKNRVRLIEEKVPELTVSIHQNSYSDGTIKGAQTFYFSGSDESRKLAGFIQERLVTTVDEENHRKEKVNDDYYLLRNTTCPAVIVECGFLSNDTECRLLETDYYREKVAWAIYMGIMRYLNAK